MSTMHQGRSALFILCIGALCCASVSAEPEAPSGAEVFSKAVQFYKTGNYDSTIAVIRDFLMTYGKDPAAEYCVPLILEAFGRKGDFSSFNRLFDLYEKKYPSSAFMPRCYYLHGFVQVKDRLFGAALISFSKALSAGVSNDLDSLIMSSTAIVCANAPDAGTLHGIGSDSGNHPRIREIARYYEIKKLLSSGDLGKVKTCCAEFKQAYPDSRFIKEISGLDTAAALPKDRVSLGLLAPLSGDDADVGRRVSQGLRLAIDKYNSQHPLQLQVIACDTKGSLLETARRTAWLLGQVPVIIGPMLSPTATVTAGMLAGRETVMLSPTATDDGIAELGPGIFQMNITLGVLARKLARYASGNLNIREYAIVAPRTPYGSSMAALFRDEIVKNGGSVFDEEYFDEGGNDFTAQFAALRRKLLVRKLDLAAKAAALPPVTRLTPADSVKWADSSVSIGAIFMPSDADDAVMLAPQVAFNRIRAQLLGSSGWRSPKTIADGKQYVRNAIISAPFEPDSTWKKWPDFRKEYASRFHEEPDRVAALGYDAGALIAAALEKAGTASRIAESIVAAAQKFEGASGVISIDRTARTNSEAVILKIMPYGFIRVQ